MLKSFYALSFYGVRNYYQWFLVYTFSIWCAVISRLYYILWCNFLCIYNWNFAKLVWIFILMQSEGTDLSALIPSASANAIDLISVSGIIGNSGEAVLLFSYGIWTRFTHQYWCLHTRGSHFALGIPARDQKRQKSSSMLSFRWDLHYNVHHPFFHLRY